MRSFIITAAVALSGHATAPAGTILIEKSVNGQPFQQYGDPIPTNGIPVHIVIDETIPPRTGFGNDDVVFRIFDADEGVPDDSIASISVYGAIQEGEVRLLVAKGLADDPDAIWPVELFHELTAGVLHIGGAGLPAVNFGSTDLAKRSRFAAAVLGNVYGHITAGRVARIQAQGRNDANNQLIDGVISGNITSTQEDEFSEANNAFPPRWFRDADKRQLAIGFIACNTLTGTVRANTPDTFRPGITIYEHNASIDVIRVGEFAPDDGAGFALSGDILAPAGRIGSITIGCPIKPATVNGPLPRIWAGNGVWVIDTFRVNDLPRDVDVHAHIKTAWETADGGAIPDAWDQRFDMPLAGDVGGFPHTGLLWPQGNETRGRCVTFEQSMHKFEIGGDFVGTIEAKNLSSPRYHLTEPEWVPPIGWWGISIGGTFTGKLHVRDRVLTANIMAASFIEPGPPVPGEAMIAIGTYLKGSVIAKSATGAIPSIDIGNDSLAEEPGNGDPDDRIGFLGSWNPPCQPSLDVPTDVVWSEHQEPDAMIRASAIGWLNIESMNYGTRIPNTPITPSIKRFPPRIECPTIGSLVVDELACGVVWSGVRDDPDPNDFDNDYTEVTTVQIGCAQDGVDLWLDTLDVVVAGNFGGRIHMQSLAANGIIRVGNFWREDGEQCAMARVGGQAPGGGIDETSPRDADLCRDYNVAGIRIAQEGGLHGQIITGTAHAESWTGTGRAQSVFVGSANPEAITENSTFGPQENTPLDNPGLRTSPHYLTRSAALGGGAIGELPFALHPLDGVPKYSDNPEHPEPISRGGLASGNQPWVLAFYGPITITGTPMEVQFYDLTQNPPAWTDLTDAFTFTIAANGRDLELRGDGSPALAVGMYRARPTQQLKCLVDGAATVPVAEFPDPFQTGDVWTHVLATCSLMGGLLHPADVTCSGGTFEEPCEPDGKLTLDDILCSWTPTPTAQAAPAPGHATWPT